MFDYIIVYIYNMISLNHLRKLSVRLSSAGIKTGYGLDGPGIEARCGRDFQHPSRRSCGPPNLLYNGYRVFLGGRAAGT